MIALVVLRNGLPRMMGVSSSSSPMSRTMKSTGVKWSCILTMTSFAIPSGNQIDWSAICNCIYVGYKGSLPNKYSYVTLDIMLTPDPISQKALWKILCPINTQWSVRLDLPSIHSTGVGSLDVRMIDVSSWSGSSLATHK